MVRVPRITGAAAAFLGLALVGPAPSAAQRPDTATVINAPTNPLLQGFRWRSIGPTGQGGRVDDFAVDPTDVRTFFVGFATGGLWKTTNNGVTFRPVFDSYGTHSIGAVAIAPSNPKIVYVGTGEANNRQSSSFGAGLYKSTDGGETFTYMGLRETQTIARIRVHPTNPDVVWVAANGHLFGPNPERGVYKSNDGGATWTQVLKVDENTGATDLVVDPSNPNTLFAATYQRRRTACCFVGGGPGSGIWRSDDGGDHWTRLTGHGLPDGTMGRISLRMTAANPDIVYAQIEVAADKAPKLSAADKTRWARLARADSLPPDPQYSGIWRSTDKGATWEFRSNEDGRPMYFSELRVSPQDPNLVYVVDLNVHKSTDGGRTFTQLSGYGHVDQHAFWIDPANDDHMMIGNDGSVDVTWDEGATWESLRTWAVGQSYYASVDMRRPYYVCTGLQDNGSWCGPSSVRTGDILAQDWYRVGGGDGFYSAVDPTDYHIVYAESQNGNIRRVDMATGEQGSIRPRPGAQGRESNIVPAPPDGTQLRWNWNAPFVISPHNPRTILLGANRLFISRDRGDSWTMTQDLTRNIDRDKLQIMGVKYSEPRCDQNVRGEPCILSRNDGVSSYGTIVSLSESPIVPGLYWVGTDDGNIQVSRDGGATWAEVGKNIPGGTRDYYVSRVEASHFDPGTAYASLDGHRSDDLAPYVFVTRDYGATWTSIASDLPAFGNVNTVRQDPVNSKILYAGTEFGFFISGNEGGSWVRFMPGLPVVRVDDVLVHPRDHDLVLSTHGRSIWILDDVTALEAMTDEIRTNEDVHLFQPRDAVLWRANIERSRSVTGDKNWAGENAPAGTAIQYYLKAAATGPVKITVTDAVSGAVFRNLDGTDHAGLNRVQWDLRGNSREAQGGGRGGGGFGRARAPEARPGVYRVTVSVNGTDYTTTLNVLDDAWLNER